MHKKILTIIIPSYKTSKYIDDCLPFFVIDEIRQDINIFLIDDGSPDDSYFKALKYQKKYPGLFYAVHKENGGHGSVINYAIKNLIDTKYFKVIDGDDWVDKNGLVSLVNFLKSTDSDLIISDFTKCFTNAKVYVKCFDTERTRNYLGYQITLHSATFKTIIFQKNNILVREKCFYEDNEYSLFPLEFVQTISYCPHNVYMYRLDNSGQSVSVNSLLQHEKDYLNVKNDILAKYKFWIKNINNEKLITYTSYILSGFYLWLFQNNLLKKRKKNELRIIQEELKQNQAIYKIVKKEKIYRLISFLDFNLLPIKRLLLNLKYRNK